jgi:hypothetical protein
MSKQLNFYFIHAQWLKDREKIITEFSKLVNKYKFKNISNVEIHTITKYDPPEIDGDIISKTVSYSQIPNEPLNFYNQFIKNLHVFQLSNALKHYHALEIISQSQGEDNIHIVLEDDVLYEDKICRHIENLLEELEAEPKPLVYLGLPSNTENKEAKFQKTKELFRILPYTDSYIITKSAAKSLYDNYLPIMFVNNIQMSYALDKAEITPVLHVPNLFMDGSKAGIVLSTLTPNNQLMFNNDYMKCRMIIQKESISEEDTQLLEKIFKESPLNSHPDFVYLKALYSVKILQFDKAKEHYEKALEVYQANGCVLNHESQFLKDYTSLFKHIQVLP